MTADAPLRGREERTLTEHGDHLLRHARHLLQVAARAGGHLRLSKNNLKKITQI